MRARFIAAGVALLAAAGPAYAQPPQKYNGPDDPATVAAAKAALPNAKVLDISGKVLDVVGVTRGIEGVIRDLNAKVTATEVTIELNADVLFDFDKYTLRPEANDTLQKVVTVVNEYPKKPLSIVGHTDSKGTHAHNVTLSEQRATAVKAWLTQHGVDGGRITTSGMAETKPVAPNTKPDGSDNPEGRQKNRRVELTLKTG